MHRLSEQRILVVDKPHELPEARGAQHIVWLVIVAFLESEDAGRCVPDALGAVWMDAGPGYSGFFH